jgi:hypothetical protein
VPPRLASIATVLIVAVACAPDTGPQWMKPGPYTTDEFKRDATECSRSGDLDHACMKERGWVAVRPSRPLEIKKQPDQPIYRPPNR